MKTLLIILILGAAAYWGYKHLDAEPNFDHPVYAQVRINMPAANRNLEFVLFGLMSSEKECRKETKTAFEKMIEKCDQCSMSVSACTPELEPRYQKLFNDQPINTTYIKFSRKAKDERAARMVIWGVTRDESQRFCALVRTELQPKFTGEISCIEARPE